MRRKVGNLSKKDTGTKIGAFDARWFCASNGSLFVAVDGQDVFPLVLGKQVQIRVTRNRKVARDPLGKGASNASFGYAVGPFPDLAICVSYGDFHHTNGPHKASASSEKTVRPQMGRQPITNLLTTTPFV